MVKLSVVTPTYNRRDSLRVTIEGLAKQSYPADLFEHVVVSDGSTDGTAEMLAELAPTLPFTLRAVNQPNGGPSKARNRGIRESVNDVVVFLDDDVEPIPEFLERHAVHHRADDKVAVLGPMSPDSSRAAEEPIWIAWEHAKLQDIYDLFRPGGEHYGQKGGPMHFYSGNASVRREWLVQVGGFDESYTRQEDVELAVRLERDCGVWFEFDLTADGIHRPTRTYKSWVAIPAAYGTLDAQRIQEGTLNWRVVEHLMRSRNPATKMLSGLCRVMPRIAPATNAVLRNVAVGLNAVGQKGPAIAALSALYNSIYAQKMYAALSAAGWKPTSRA